MKFSHTVSFDLETIDIIDQYMSDNRIKNFSFAVCQLIKEQKRFKKIALKLQKKE